MSEEETSGKIRITSPVPLALVPPAPHLRKTIITQTENDLMQHCTIHHNITESESSDGEISRSELENLVVPRCILSATFRSGPRGRRLDVWLKYPGAFPRHVRPVRPQAASAAGVSIPLSPRAMVWGEDPQLWRRTSSWSVISAISNISSTTLALHLEVFRRLRVGRPCMAHWTDALHHLPDVANLSLSITPLSPPSTPLSTEGIHRSIMQFPKLRQTCTFATI